MEPEWIRAGTFLLSHKDSAKVEAAKVTGRRISISGMLKFLGVSRSRYRSFLHRKVSPSRQQKDAVKKEIQKIYDYSKQNYGCLLYTSFGNQLCDHLRILPVILALAVVIQFLGLLYRIRVLPF